MDFRCRYCLEVFKSKRADKQFCSDSHRAQYGNLSKKRKSEKDEAFDALPAIKEIDKYEILEKSDFDRTMAQVLAWHTEKNRMQFEINELKFQLEKCKETPKTAQYVAPFSQQAQAPIYNRAELAQRYKAETSGFFTDEDWNDWRRRVNNDPLLDDKTRRLIFN